MDGNYAISGMQPGEDSGPEAVRKAIHPDLRRMHGLPTAGLA